MATRMATRATETPGLLTRATDIAGLQTRATETPGSPGFMDFMDVGLPLEEPVDDNLDDPADFPPNDPIWDDFYAQPPKLPKDPLTEWERKWEWDMVNS
jgi:hypothetical protein